MTVLEWLKRLDPHTVVCDGEACLYAYQLVEEVESSLTRSTDVWYKPVLVRGRKAYALDENGRRLGWHLEALPPEASGHELFDEEDDEDVRRRDACGA